MGATLDAGALIAFERGGRQVVALVARTLERGDRLSVPAGVVAQVWRDGAHDDRVIDILHSSLDDLADYLATMGTRPGVMAALYRLRSEASQEALLGWTGAEDEAWELATSVVLAFDDAGVPPPKGGGGLPVPGLGRDCRSCR